ncbi:MAG: DUF58 domain-containing protein [Deltaproteobacteria bacterium]|nr:DUF58 domain-containing protein [Deltaproteobacteria bacterium]
MIKADVFAKIKRMQLRAGYLTSDALAGGYSSVFRGLGQEFDKVREYIPGDDIRSIDWNVTARMCEPYVKVFREEREMTLMLLVDVSPSQRFGTTGLFKQEQAAELAAILALLAIRNHDKVGLLVFSDHVEQFIRPGKGQSHVWNIIRSVLTHEGHGHQTDLTAAIDYMMQVIRKKSMCFLISDFQSGNYENSLRSLARKHDLTCCVVSDPAESQPAAAGLLQLTDPETGDVYVVDSSSRAFQEDYRSASTRDAEEMIRLFRRNKAGYFQLSTAQPVADQLLRYLKERERRAQR